ncbi:MAG: pilus assembly protein N-terminal domain-containing protein [Myxococcales bacterium]|nr:pilus assembly protein N-terminal domain-containing protein [Myxococcales bacterium]
MKTLAQPATQLMLSSLLFSLTLGPAIDEAAAQEGTGSSLTLEVGQQHVISSDGIESYSEGVSGIVDVRLTKDGRNFVIVGLREGETSLLLLHRDGGSEHLSIAVHPQPGAPPARRPTEEDPDRVEARDNIRLDFFFVQLSDDGSHQVGFAWPASYGGGNARASFDLLSGSFDEATAVVTDQALPRLDFAQSRGFAKLMRKAAVITANGSEANFGGGGEVNIPVQSALNVGVQRIEYGSHIKVRPRYDRESGRIELQIHAEVSDLASDHGSGIPGRITSTLDSVINLELGQSLVLAGLTARSESASKRGLPLLSQIPIVGALFGTHGGRSEHTENLIFIVPSVVDAVSLDARERVQDALRAFNAFDGDLDESSLKGGLDPRPPPGGGSR